MSVTREWKVYGLEGHRQRESFSPSYRYDFSNEKGGTRILEVENSDKTGTNKYSLIRITRNTAEECEAEFFGQLYDGIFENSNVGGVIEVRYYTACRETGDRIDSFYSLLSARNAIECYEAEDEENDTYVEDFYCIQDIDGVTIE